MKKIVSVILCAQNDNQMSVNSWKMYTISTNKKFLTESIKLIQTCRIILQPLKYILTQIKGKLQNKLQEKGEFWRRKPEARMYVF